jgi:hypothetical protein
VKAQILQVKRSSLLLKVAVEDMARSKAEEWRPGADISPVIVCIGNAKMASVFAGVAITVSGKGRLVVVMEVVAENLSV